MRIIKGKFQRRLIQIPAGLPVRPTTDLAKESLFNILENRLELEGARALDLFSGTGSIAYELVSRGCNSVTAVDNNPKCIQLIIKTANLFQMKELLALRSEVFRFLAMQKLPFDFIFADPPYEMEAENYQKMAMLIFERQLLKPDGILVIEHHRNIDYSKHPYFVEMRNYGKVHFSFFGAAPMDH